MADDLAAVWLCRASRGQPRVPRPVAADRRRPPSRAAAPLPPSQRSRARAVGRLQLRFEPRRGTAQIYRVPLPRELVGPVPRQLHGRKRQLGGLLLGLNVAGAAGGLVIGTPSVAQRNEMSTHQISGFRVSFPAQFDLERESRLSPLNQPARGRCARFPCLMRLLVSPRRWIVGASWLPSANSNKTGFAVTDHFDPDGDAPSSRPLFGPS
jgi:hypothetical protein